MRIAINGFGRIGKTFLRCLLLDNNPNKIEVVAINIGPSDKKLIAQLFAYDTLMGKYPSNVTFEQDMLIVDNQKIEILSELDPEQLPWKNLNIDWVVESSGKFTKAQDARKHITAGARRVLITAPAHDEDITIIPGVNSADYDAKNHTIVSLGSCTTNALVPTLHLVHKNFGIMHGFMTTVHAYTNSQVLLDRECPDPRRARAAALNIIPTSTGASRVLDKVIPTLKGKIISCALRVPIAKVSLIDLTCVIKSKIDKQEINEMFDYASQNESKGILALCNEPLVSSDYKGNNNSVVIDGLLTQTQDNLIKIFGWYDNEWGYSQRLKDFLIMSN